LPLKILFYVPCPIFTLLAFSSSLEACEEGLDVAFDEGRWVLAVFAFGDYFLAETAAALFADECAFGFVEAGYGGLWVRRRGLGAGGQGTRGARILGGGACTCHLGAGDT
jgi:hypothetical protein